MKFLELFLLSAVLNVLNCQIGGVVNLGEVGGGRGVAGVVRALILIPGPEYAVFRVFTLRELLLLVIRSVAGSSLSVGVGTDTAVGWRFGTVGE